jgi:hypothetical protein
MRADNAALWIGVFFMLSYPLAALHWIGYRKWHRARGTVIRLAADPNPGVEDGDLTAPVVRFQTAEGREVEFTDPLYSTGGQRSGDKVEVLYPPDKPQYARVAGNLYTMQILFGTFGAVIVLLGLVFGE